MPSDFFTFLKLLVSSIELWQLLFGRYMVKLSSFLNNKNVTINGLHMTYDAQKT